MTVSIGFVICARQGEEQHSGSDFGNVAVALAVILLGSLVSETQQDSRSSSRVHAAAQLVGEPA